MRALGGVMTMKVGVQGRVLLGPAGGPGRVDVPLRFAVVQEGTNPKPIVSKLYRLAVDVRRPDHGAVRACRPGRDLPDAARGRARQYIVYVGFDPSAAPAKPERKQKKR